MVNLQESSDTQAGSTPVEIRDADPPFNHSTADFIFRSRDHVDFRVHKALVSLASPSFDGLLSLPPPITDGIVSINEVKDGLPVIPFPEDQQTLLYLLCSCHGFAPDVLPPLTVQGLKSVCAAHDKYVITAIHPRVHDTFISVAKEDPVAVYAIACHYRMDKLMLAAAKLSLLEPALHLSHSPELGLITGLQYSNLIHYHQECKEVAANFASKDWSWCHSLSDVPLGQATSACPTCRTQLILEPTTVVNGSVLDGNTGKYIFYAPSWWFQFLTDGTTSAKLKETPCGSAIRDRAFLAPVLKKAVSCANVECRLGVPEMLDFCDRFAAAVDEAVSRVRFLRILLRLPYTCLILLRRQVTFPTAYPNT
ncbi:hypothetical protein EVG20_g1886 [Dentipellis fragilis]|uniref:BTB domain-containing protein n=1 Tax=Dentipellis fragilis TaxID=205917 RepID=A0A4Y9Z9I5_9AGAM|nr:hypothetical protein EVG20_g1886 [Dentipellis fragilis]